MKQLFIIGLVGLGLYLFKGTDKRAWLVNYFKTHNLGLVASLVDRMTDNEVNFLYDTIHKYAGSTALIPSDVSYSLDSLSSKYGFSWS
jgi:hypothetical protein